MYRLFLHMYVWILLKYFFGLTITLDCWFTLLSVCDASFLVCSLPSWMFTQLSKGHTHSTFHVLEPFMHLPWIVAHVTPLLPTRTPCLPLHATVVKAIPYDPLLVLLHKTVWALVGTSYGEIPWYVGRSNTINRKEMKKLKQHFYKLKQVKTPTFAQKNKWNKTLTS